MHFIKSKKLSLSPRAPFASRWLQGMWVLSHNNNNIFPDISPRRNHLRILNSDGNEWANGKRGFTFEARNDDHLRLKYAADNTALGLKRWTIIARARSDSSLLPTAASTGASGVSAYPLVTKGRGEADGDNRDANYFLGMDATFHVAADFEDSGAGDNNNPLTGATALTDGAWYDFAYTFDGSTAKVWYREVGVDPLFIEDGSLTGITDTPRYDSIQPFAISTALNSSSTYSGNWGGQIEYVAVFSESLDNRGLETFDIREYYETEEEAGFVPVVGGATPNFLSLLGAGA